jgi:hypothetical protein
MTCSGCIPFRWRDTPHVTGSVFDSTTSLPIVGARLDYADFPKYTVYTDSAGRFDFLAIHHWSFIVLLPIDRLPPHSVLCVEAAGYATTNATFFGWYNRTNKAFQMVRQ